MEMLLSSHGHWHLVQKHWLPRRRRARPSAALDELERIITHSRAKRKSIRTVVTTSSNWSGRLRR